MKAKKRKRDKAAEAQVKKAAKVEGNFSFKNFVFAVGVDYEHWAMKKS